ncbi:type II secretion system F family protein [Oryzomonas japonica]|uniref:Type II secretion system F family protein n=1 Tax=Oryzomonas japonica TaxID=2603858 RepID=A0A7J4ZT46_9BACT|nr:type II secretion system F family protein [Oryzomonas japonica]KAB0666533.1 type II secretion system F family protein [Oryzomonas japonica]
MFLAVFFTFVAVFLLVSALVLAYLRSQESPKAVLKRRLRRMAKTGVDDAMSEDLRSEIIKETPQFERLVTMFRFGRAIGRLLDHAGVAIDLTMFILLVILLPAVSFCGIFLFTHRLIFAVCAALAAAVVPFMFLYFKKVRRQDKFTEQLPDALSMISRSLRAGHSLTSAIELVAQESDEPLRDLFKTAYEQQKLGLRITDSLAGMTDRMESIDLRFFVASIELNNDIGGNLSEILDKLAGTIRERLKIKRQVQVITAQGRLSGYILAALPIATFFMFNIMMPGYEDVLFKEKLGSQLLIGAICAQLSGFLWIKKIISIKV